MLFVVTRVPVAQVIVCRLRGCLAATAAPGLFGRTQSSQELVEASHSNLNDPDLCAGRSGALEGRASALKRPLDAD